MTIKTDREIEMMKRAGAIVAGAHNIAQHAIVPGMTTEQLSTLIDNYIVDHGATPSFKNYNGFPAAACISVNEQVVHGIPGPRVLNEGDIVSIDIGAKLDGYHGDAARTWGVGQITEDKRRLIQVTEQAFWDGIQFAVAGNRIGDISAAVQKIAENAGYGVVRELIGHGVGQNLHEPPDVPNFGRAGHGVRLVCGMTIAVEPMINLGTKDVLMLDDGWTVITADGLVSAHYENTIAITDGEPVVLTLL